MTLTPEQRTLALCHAFGWQGGTIHQLAQETGCTVHDLLYADERTNDTDNAHGWFAVRTCTMAFNKATNFPKAQGRIQFWLGAASGQYAKDCES